MATVTRKGELVETVGELPQVGQIAPDFTLVKADLSDVTLASLLESGRIVVLNIFPSIDTPTCATSVREFNQRAASLEGVDVLCVSADLPFAQARFCGAEGIDHVMAVSSFRSTFGADYGVSFASGPLRGLLSRAVVVIGKDGKVLLNEQVSNISNEPNYEAAFGVLVSHTNNS